MQTAANLRGIIKAEATGTTTEAIGCGRDGVKKRRQSNCSRLQTGEFTLYQSNTKIVNHLVSVF